MGPSDCAGPKPVSERPVCSCHDYEDTLTPSHSLEPLPRVPAEPSVALVACTHIPLQAARIGVGRHQHSAARPGQYEPGAAARGTSLPVASGAGCCVEEAPLSTLAPDGESGAVTPPAAPAAAAAAAPAPAEVTRAPETGDPLCASVLLPLLSGRDWQRPPRAGQAPCRQQCYALCVLRFDTWGHQGHHPGGLPRVQPERVPESHRNWGPKLVELVGRSCVCAPVLRRLDRGAR